MRVHPEPLPFHRAIVEHFRSEEPALWNWFAASRATAQQSDAVRLDLLKTTYRIESTDQTTLYELAGAARDKMQLNCQVTLYQAQAGHALNVALAYLPGEAHIVLSGAVTDILNTEELSAVFAHEFAHYQLFERDQGSYLVAQDLLHALSADPASGLSASESMRLFSLWSEIFADRWACLACDDVLVSIAALVKVATGLHEVSAESYLRQANEIIAKGLEGTDQISHPELYIRARALELWNEQGDQSQAEIERMIDGQMSLNRLDLLDQKKAAQWTREFINRLLTPDWFRTEAVIAHPQQFFPDFIPESTPFDGATFRARLGRFDSSMRDYFCYLMLDFVTVDRDIRDMALPAAIVLAQELDLHARFVELAQKELALGKKAFAKIQKAAEVLLAQMETSHTP
jgi:Zn-dependent protease with chaperone function